MKLIDDIIYIKHVIFHPFDAFYEMKHRGRANYKIAAGLLILYGITGIFSTQYTGFAFNFYPVFALDSISLFLACVLPLILFIVSNFSTSSLMNGNGKFKDIFAVACYSLIPLIFIDAITVIISNGIIIEEGPILIAFSYIGKIWFCYLIFCGLCVIHEYTMIKNILTLFITLIAAIIIIFLCVLYLSLLDRVIIFINTVASEISKRW